MTRKNFLGILTGTPVRAPFSTVAQESVVSQNERQEKKEYVQEHAHMGYA